MPVDGKTVNPYRKYVCWHGVRGERINGFAAQRWCGDDASYYKLERPNRLGWSVGSSYTFAWLCSTHVRKLEKAGYAVTLVGEL